MRSVARAVVIGVMLVGSPAAAAEKPKPPPKPDPADDQGDVVVTGHRGSAVTDVAPLQVLDADTIMATGATTMAELLRAIRSVTTSADGSPPIFLLNAQRVSGYDEIGTLPPEAIEKVEVLPEEAALKFGYPPTRRVVNFITKRHFRTIEVSGSTASTTEGYSGAQTAHTALTRLRNDTRLTLSADYSHTDGLRLSQRHILPDPSVPFDAIGNIEGLADSEIDPALSAAAGQIVTQAPVPADPADRSSLAAYAAGANMLRPFEDGLRSLAPTNDTIKANAIYATPITKTISGSISLSAERSYEHSLSGAAPVVLFVPGGNPYSPFTDGVLLYRALTEADPLRLRQTKTTLHGGGTLRGAIHGWQWDLTAAYDSQEGDARNDIGIDTTAANAAIAAGADPFIPLAPELLGDRLTDRLHSLVQTANSKATVTGTPFVLPAGKATLTAGAEVERGTADSSTRGADASTLHLGRTRAEASLAIDLPIADRREDVLPVLGQLSLNGSVNVRTVTGYGTLHDATYGASWNPVTAVQLLATDKLSETAPDMASRSNPVTRADNATVLDYGTGQTLVTTIVSGGNPDLAAARSEVRSLALNVKPFPKRELRFSATFEATRARDAATNVYALTPQTRAILPDLFVSDASGRLTSVTFEPINAYRTWTKTLNLQVNSSGQIGAAPPSAATPGAGKPKPDTRAFYYGGIGVYLTLDDRVELRRSTPVFDILAGETISGGGFPHAVGYLYGGINQGGLGAKLDAQWVGGSRVDGGVPSTDLRFLAKPNLDFGIYASLHHFLPHDAWTKQFRISLDVTDAFDSRQQVRDGNDQVPYRFQPEALTPVARTVKLSLRKLF